MADKNNKKDSDPKLRELYPDLSDAELLEAEYNLDRYLEHTLRMYERIKNDPVEYARFEQLLAEKKKQNPDQPASSA